MPFALLSRSAQGKAKLCSKPTFVMSDMLTGGSAVRVIFRFCSLTSIVNVIAGIGQRIQTQNSESQPQQMCVLFPHKSLLVSLPVLGLWADLPETKKSRRSSTLVYDRIAAHVTSPFSISEDTANCHSSREAVKMALISSPLVYFSSRRWQRLQQTHKQNQFASAETSFQNSESSTYPGLFENDLTGVQKELAFSLQHRSPNLRVLGRGVQTNCRHRRVHKKKTQNLLTISFSECTFIPGVRMSRD